MIYIINKGANRYQEQREFKKFQSVSKQIEDNKIQGLNNPIVEEADYETPVSKKECLTMLDKVEAESKTPEAKKAAQELYVYTKKRTSDEGTK